MSDVTGNIGSESVRLRGMALEETQYRMAQDIEELLKVQTDFAKAKFPNVFGNLGKTSRTLGENLTSMAGTSKDANNKLARLTGSFSGSSKKFEMITQSMTGLVRIIRNLDDNVGNASFSMKAMGSALRGSLGKFVDFTAESVSQLEEQFSAYRKLTDISGATASDFDDLRIAATRTGVTLQEYVGLVQDNFTNLRLGGNTVSTTIKKLTDSLENIRDDDTLPYLMQRMGIAQGEYSKVILAQTSLMGGFNKVYEENSANFGSRMVNLIKTSTGLANAFGAQRSQIMDAMKKLSEDQMFAQYFENLPDPKEVKDTMLKSFLAMGLSPEEAKQMVVSTLSGVPTPFYQEMVAAGAEPLLDATKKMADELSKNPKNVDEIMRKNLPMIGETLKSWSKEFGSNDDIARFFADPNSPLRRAFEVMISGNRKFSEKSFDDMSKSINDFDKKNKTTLDTLTDVQKENIRLAATAALTNKALNAFGLTAAAGVQLLTGAMIEGTGAVIKPLAETPEFKELNRLMRDYTQQGNKVSVELAKDLENIIKRMTENVRADSSTRQTSTNTTRQPNAQTVSSSGLLEQKVRVKINSRGDEALVPISEIDRLGGQATAGGPTPLGIKQLLALLQKASSQQYKVTAIRDVYHQGMNSSHNDGNAIDLVLPPGSSKADYAKAKEEIQNHLSRLGIKDFYVQDEANNPSQNSTGDHIHVQVKDPAQVQKIFDEITKTNQSNNQQTSPSSNVPSNDPSQQSSAQPPSSASPPIATAINNNEGAGSGDLNTTLVAHLRMLITETNGVKTAVESLDSNIKNSGFLS